MPVLDTFIAALLGSLHLVMKLALRAKIYHVSFIAHYILAPTFNTFGGHESAGPLFLIPRLVYFK